ncbi:MAG TPA: hypothetical protein VMJ14_08940 [Burkholderiales bacterium]|nr:hypothetical protein [Burkholderiales bacterium]
MDLEKTAMLGHHAPHFVARRRVGSDRRAQRDAAVLGDFRRDKADAQDVEIPVRMREPELRGQVLAHHVAVQQRHRTLACLEQSGEQGLGNRRFSRARQAGEEHGHALPVPRRLRAAQFIDHFGIRKPRRDLGAFAQSAPELRT